MKRHDETQTAYAIRCIREQALEELRDRIMSLEPDASAIAEQHKTGFRAGHTQCRYASRDLITEMLSEE